MRMGGRLVFVIVLSRLGKLIRGVFVRFEWYI